MKNIYIEQMKRKELKTLWEERQRGNEEIRKMSK